MDRIDGYQIFAELKNGPVTTVFKAFDTRRNQVVLIKLLQAEAAIKEHWRAQFMQESRISAQLNHPNLRRTLHAGTLADQPYIVLEYVEGPTLAELIKQHKKLPIDLCIYIAKELARAIAAVHRNKVLHRDIKPQNIFLSMSGAVKLGDLGSAHELADVSPLTIGTPAYMSPEYILGQEVGESSDLFSLGAVLYEILTGEVAFVNRTLASTLLHVVNWDPVPISKLRPETPAELIITCQKLLAKKSAERYGSAKVVLDDLSFLGRSYGLSTNQRDLAQFLESPETYEGIDLKAVAQRDAARTAGSRLQRIPTLSWGVAAILSASMFLAGVLFIKGLKEYFYGPLVKAPSSSVTAPLPRAFTSANLGYLDLHLNSGGEVFIDGETIGAGPMRALMALPVGPHEIDINDPFEGVTKKNITINSGDTLRLTIDLDEPR